MSTDIPFTELLRRWSRGDEGAFVILAPVVYKEMRRLARRRMARERAGHTLQPTDVVHEAYLRLVKYKKVDWQARKHFYAVCAVIMKHVLADHARAKESKRRWGHLQRISFDEAIVDLRNDGFSVLQVNDALEALWKINPRQAEIVELRFFCGLSVEETAERLQLAEQTILRDWHFAKLWLLHHMKGQVKDKGR